jgi:hypothetical protein
MFGNSVPIEDAVNCVNACNGLNSNYLAEKDVRVVLQVVEEFVQVAYG